MQTVDSCVGMLELLSRLLVAAILGCPSLVLAYKIITRPQIHTIFNTSLACVFSIRGILGPVLFFFTISVIQKFGGGQGGTIEMGRKQNKRFMTILFLNSNETDMCQFYCPRIRVDREMRALCGAAPPAGRGAPDHHQQHHVQILLHRLRRPRLRQGKFKSIDGR